MVLDTTAHCALRNWATVLVGWQLGACCAYYSVVCSMAETAWEAQRMQPRAGFTGQPASPGCVLRRLHWAVVRFWHIVHSDYAMQCRLGPRTPTRIW